MKILSLFLVLIVLIGNVLSYKIKNDYYPVSYEYDSKNYFFTESPEIEVVTGPKHYDNNEEYVDVYGTLMNFMGSYYPTIEYEITKVVDISNTVTINMIQLYKGVPIETTSLSVDMELTTGKILSVITNIDPDFTAADFKDRGEFLDGVNDMLEYVNKLFYDGKLNLSGSYIKRGTTNTIITKPFQHEVVVKKLYYGFKKSGIYEIYNKPVWQIQLRHNRNLYYITINLDDNTGELLRIDRYETARDRDTGTEINFEELLHIPQTYVPTTTTTTSSSRRTKTIPGYVKIDNNTTTTTTTTTSAKTIPESSSITTTISTKTIPVSNCKQLTSTITEKEIVTVKETVTIKETITVTL